MFEKYSSLPERIFFRLTTPRNLAIGYAIAAIPRLIRRKNLSHSQQISFQTHPNLDDAEYAKEEFREKWDKKYPPILRSWDANWAELTTFFNYPQEIRHWIYTTNAVEVYHRMVRKFTKTKAIFPTDDSIRKVVFLSIREILKKWTMAARDWPMAYSQILIYFADRFAA